MGGGNMTPEESREQFAKRIDAIGRYFEKYVSENITQYVFGGTKVARYVKRVANYPSYFNNIFSLAFIFAQGCLRCDNDSEDPVNQKASKQGSIRVINSLKKAYLHYPVTHELIQFVLSDIQFDMLQADGGELREVFENLCTFRPQDTPLATYYRVIAQWRASPSRFNMDGNELAGLFQSLLTCMTFLKNYDLERDEDGNLAFVKKDSDGFDGFDDSAEKYSYIPLNHMIYYDPEKYADMYSLYAVEKREADGVKRLGLRYVSGDGFNSLSFIVGENLAESSEGSELQIAYDAGDYYYEIFGEDWSFAEEDAAVKKNNNFIDQVHAINYKYIKNLALAISDTISTNRGSKRALYRAYHMRHKDVFREVTEWLSNNEDIESLKIDWDGIIVMLLIESSPTSVLETLFRAVPQTFMGIARNLCRRIGNEEVSVLGKNDRELTEMVKEVMRTKLILGETSGFGKIPRVQSDERLFARAAALLVVSSLSTAHEEETMERTICAGNIYDNITLLRRMKSDASNEQKCHYVSIILGETFRHLLCFYRGLLAYGEIKVAYDAESGTHCFSEVQLASYQKRLQTAFFDAAKAEAASLAELDSAELDGVRALLSRFTSLCEDCSSSAVQASVSGRNLYAAIGRHDLLDVAEFKAYTRMFTENYRSINESNVDAWISFALDILMYLRSGSFKPREESLFNAIYPFTATYNRGNENYDGYKTVTFTLNIDHDNDGVLDSKEYINVLSEFTYSLTNVFYCLPNVLRSNKKWWIDPVLISFKDFNDIFI